MSSLLCFFSAFLYVLQVRTLWATIREKSQLPEGVSAKDYLSLDDALLTESVREDSELARDALIKTSGDGNDSSSSSSSADDEDDVEVTSPRLSTATEGIHDVREYLASLQGVPQEVMVALSRIDAFILSRAHLSTQKSITDFFTPQPRKTGASVEATKPGGDTGSMCTSAVKVQKRKPSHLSSGNSDSDMDDCFRRKPTARRAPRKRRTRIVSSSESDDDEDDDDGAAVLKMIDSSSGGSSGGSSSSGSSDGSSSSSSSDESKDKTPPVTCSTSLKMFQRAVFEHELPIKFSQSWIDGRNGSSACTVIAAIICRKVLDGALFLSNAVSNQGAVPQEFLQELIASIREGNVLYDCRGARLGLLSAYDAVQLSPPDQALRIRRGLDLHIRDFAGAKGVVESLCRNGDKSWQAGILVQTPISISVAIRAEPFAFAVFDSHHPVVALSGRSAGKDTLAEYLVHLFLRRFGLRLGDAELCLLERV